MIVNALLLGSRIYRQTKIFSTIMHQFSLKTRDQMTLKQVFSVFGMLVLRTILLICRRMLMRLVIQVLSFHLGISNYSGNIFRFTLGIVVIEKACTDPALPLGLPLRGREYFFSYNPPFLLRYVAFRKLSLKI